MPAGVVFLCRICWDQWVCPHFFHVIGWVELPRVHEFVLLAQLAIGGGVGARLARVPFTEVIEHLKIASINTLMILVQLI